MKILQTLLVLVTLIFVIGCDEHHITSNDLDMSGIWTEISGTITNDKGNYISSARVFVPPNFSTHTNVFGYYETQMFKGGEADITISAPGYVTHYGTVMSSGDPIEYSVQLETEIPPASVPVFVPLNSE